MKKLNKSYIALATACAIGMSANAQTLQDSLSGGKISGEIRSTSVFASYTDEKASSINNNAKAGAIGLQLNYKTGDFHGFKAEVGFQTAKDLKLNKESNLPPTQSEDEPRASAKGTNMYLANLEYTTGKTSIKVGRQLISTPLIKNSNVFTLRDSFQALAITNKDIPDTELRFYAINEWYQRYTAEFGNDRATHFDKPVYSLYAKNKSIKNLTLEGQYMTTNHKGSNGDVPVTVTDGYTTYFGSFDYKLPTSFPLSIGGLYAGATFDKADQKDTNFYGVKIGTKIANIGVKLAYTSVSDDNNYPGALGHTPNFFRYNSRQTFLTNLYAGVSTVSIVFVPKFNISGFSTYLAFSSYSQSDKGMTVSNQNIDGALESQVNFAYKFSGQLKGLSARWQIAQLDYDDNTIDDDKMTISRLYLNYKF